MSLKENLKAGWITVKENIITYLLTTTIHGLRYLHDGRNLFEKLIWLIIIGASFSGAIWFILNGLNEANDEPILTSLETIEVKNVPFPAITIGGDDNVNKWGFVEKFLNFLTFYDPKVITLHIYLVG